MIHPELSSQQLGAVTSHGIITWPRPATSIDIQVNDSHPNVHHLLLQRASIDISKVDFVRYSSNSPIALDDPSYRPVPPPLAIQRPIPLPPLSDSPIAIHPLLTYSPFAPTPIIYDLSFPPTAALFSPAQTPHTFWVSNPEDWRTYPAMTSDTVSSITIRVPGIERPIVVLPGTLEQGVPTVGDVLDAIYSMVRLECMIELESHMPVDPGACSINPMVSGGDPLRRPGALFPFSAATDNLLVACIRHRLRNASVWMGLHSSEQEVDVWILQTEVFPVMRY